MNDTHPISSDGPTRDDYFMSDLDAQRDYLQSRRAEKWIPFLLRYLKPGMTVLNCGCGQGSITVDVAERVAPGHVTGIDFDPSQVADARSLAEQRAVRNVTFQQGSIYQLDFPDESFDVVYAHAVLQHLSERDRAIAEMKRVLKATGIVGIADDDYTTLIVSPDDGPPRRGLSLIQRLIAHNGGDLQYSRHLHTILLKVAFAEVEGHLVAAEYYGLLAETRRAARMMGRVLSAPDFTDVVIGEGWITHQELDTLLKELADWGERPDAFLG